MHFWGIISMLILCAVFFSVFIAEIITDWIRKEYRRVDMERKLDDKYMAMRSCIRVGMDYSLHDHTMNSDKKNEKIEKGL